MFDLSGIQLAPNADFETALKKRGEDIIDCPGDLSSKYAYDRSKGVDSIVYEVRN